MRTRIDMLAGEGLAQLGGAMRSPEPERFRLNGVQCAFGDVLISDLTTTSLEHTPTEGATVPFPPPGSVNLVFVVGGAVQITVDRSSYVFVVGSAAVLPTAALPSFACAESTRVLWVSVGGAHVAAFEGLLPDRPAGLAAAVVNTHPTFEFLTALARAARDHPIRVHPTASIVTTLCAALLGADNDWHTRPEDPLVAQVLAAISEHHTDAGFDAKALARAVSTTPRGLAQLLTERHGGKQAAELLRERRLVAAMTLLQPEAGLSVERVAARCGFRTPADLVEALGEVYGLDAQDLVASVGPGSRERLLQSGPSAEENSQDAAEAIRAG